MEMAVSLEMMPLSSSPCRSFLVLNSNRSTILFFSLFLSSVYWFDFARVLVMFLNIESSDFSMIVFDLFNIYKSFLNEI